MLILISYDVAVTSNGGQKRLRHVVKALQNFGQRVQYSVFECVIDPAQWVTLKSELEKIIKPDLDSLRYYYLGSNWERKVEHVGAKPSININGPLIV